LYDDVIDLAKMKMLGKKICVTKELNDTFKEFFNDTANLVGLKTNRKELKLHRRVFLYEDNYTMLQKAIKSSYLHKNLIVREVFRAMVEKLRVKYPNYKFIKYEVIE
jgi:dimeric dUTPase (all-alpha-NTP-PPase superfamily)